MATLTRKVFDRLAAVHGARCVSIYLPTHRQGMEVMEQQDRLQFKNLLSTVEKEMLALEFGREETTEFLEPAWALWEDSTFWRHQAAALAIFLERGSLHYFHLPYAVPAFQYLSHEFYLKPLIPFFTGNGNFLLLTLNFQDVRLYKGDRHHLAEIRSGLSLPQHREEVVGEDYRPSQLNFHSGAGRQYAAVFHGQAAWIEDEKEEILQFFRAVDRELSQQLQGERAPLLVFCLPHLFPLYQQANTYGALLPEAIYGNPERLQTEALHKAAWDRLAFHFDRDRQERADRFLQFQDTPRTTVDIRSALPAAFGGLVDTLFLDRQLECWGVYDGATTEVRLQDHQERSNTSLTNLLAVKVFQQGGNVYLEDRPFLPGPYAPVNVLFRYG
ncbi:MAG: hypothetical protein RLY31_1126 [Bacteroidota bacterium]|jgi:hypothetical protein